MTLLSLIFINVLFIFNVILILLRLRFICLRSDHLILSEHWPIIFDIIPIWFSLRWLLWYLFRVRLLRFDIIVPFNRLFRSIPYVFSWKFIALTEWWLSLKHFILIDGLVSFSQLMSIIIVSTSFISWCWVVDFAVDLLSLTLMCSFILGVGLILHLL